MIKVHQEPNGDKILVVRCQDKHADSVEICLRLSDDWAATIVNVNDVVHVVWQLKGLPCTAPALVATRHSVTSTTARMNVGTNIGLGADTSGTVVINNEANALIVLPDLLLSPTQINNSFPCLRKAVLCDKFPDNRVNVACMLGTLKHDLVEFALLHDTFDFPALERQALIVAAEASNVERMYACNYGEDEALHELRGTIAAIAHFGRTYCRRGPQGAPPAPIVDGLKQACRRAGPAQGASAPTLRIGRVFATEEMIWAQVWGLKGAVDATVGVALGLSGCGAGIDSVSVAPLELKTGKKSLLVNFVHDS